jgi:hypothetical protein
MLRDMRPWGQQSLLEVAAPDLQFPRDAIDPRIDVDAQRALISMASGTNALAINDAFNALDLVKTGRLGGIYQQDHSGSGIPRSLRRADEARFAARGP